MTLKENIKRDLIKLFDPKFKKFHSKLCPGVNNLLGIRIPILRKYANDLLKEYEIKDLLTKIDSEYYEEIMLQGLLIGLEKADFESIINHIKNFIPKINNWAVCDTFCANLKITKKHKKEMWIFIQKYLYSSNEFEIRFGVVMLLDYYVEEKYIKEIFNVFNTIKIQDYYVQMAVAWALSICLIKFYEETIEYFKNSKLDKFTFNKTIQKAIESYRLTDKQKNELIKFKK